jgi:acetate kinase
MATSLGGIDALVFTGGVGEHEPSIRARAAAGLRFIGVEIDEHINASVSGDAEITAQDATVKALVVRAREDLEMAHQVERALGR